jgi:hypothetical protein
MFESEDALKKAIGEIREFERLQEKACAHLRGKRVELKQPEVLEKDLVKPILEGEAKGRVVGVDGSIVSEELHGIDLILVRSCAAAFDYREGKLSDCNYYPRATPPYEVFLKYARESHEFSWAKSIMRLRNEILTAIAAAKQFHPNAILLDGSILPQISDRPGKDSELFPEYALLVEKYKELYALAQEKGFFLVGVIKDSRGKHLIKLIRESGALLGGENGEEDFLERTNDSNFLSKLLGRGERTCAFNYSSEWKEHPVLRDFPEYAEKICSMYLKPAKYDRPLRIDFLNKIDSGFIDGIASLINSLSKQNQSYAYPAVLIEADLRALLEQQEAERVYQQLFSELGPAPSLLKLRSNSRPFR